MKDNLDLYYSMQVTNPDGSLAYDTGIRDGHSFTKQFGQWMFNVGFHLSSNSLVAMVDTSGSSVSTYTSIDGAMRVDASVATSTYGIQVGTSTAAESINDNALGAQISHGTSAGNLQYGAVTFGAPSTTATTTTFRITRVFTNGSGGTVTVEEIGLTGRDANSFLYIRDLTGSVAVNNGQQLTVNYDLTTTI